MITKKTCPVGVVKEDKGERFMKIDKVITEYRVFGILLYRKEVVSPRYFAADYWDGFYPNL